MAFNPYFTPKQPLFGQNNIPVPVPFNPSTPASGDPGFLSKVGDFLNKPGGQAVIQAGGALLNGLGERKDAEAARQQSAEQFRAGLLRDLYTSEQNLEQNAAKGVLDANPLGASTDFAARQGFMREVMPQLRNFSVTPSDPAIAAAMPHISGGLRLPENGFSPEALAAFSQQATANELASRDKQLMNLDPRFQGTNMDALGLGNQTPLQDSVRAYGAQALQKQMDEEKQQREAMLRALDNDPTGQQQPKKKGGFWRKLGKIASFAAPIIAAPFTGGASLAAIGALSGAAGGALSGGGLKGALMGGALGAIPMGGGLAKGAARPALAAGLKQAGKSAIKNPALAASVIGSVR